MYSIYKAENNSKVLTSKLILDKRNFEIYLTFYPTKLIKKL